MEATRMILKLTILIAMPCDESSDESHHADYSYIPTNNQAWSIDPVDIDEWNEDESAEKVYRFQIPDTLEVTGIGL